MGSLQRLQKEMYINTSSELSKWQLLWWLLLSSGQQPLIADTSGALHTLSTRCSLCYTTCTTCLIASMRMDAPTRHALVGVTSRLPVGRLPLLLRCCLSAHTPSSCSHVAISHPSFKLTSECPSSAFPDPVPVWEVLCANPRCCLQNILCVFLSSLLEYIFKCLFLWVPSWQKPGSFIFLFAGLGIKLVLNKCLLDEWINKWVNEYQGDCYLVNSNLGISMNDLIYFSIPT